VPITISTTRESSPPAIEAELATLHQRVAALPEAQRSVELRLPSMSSQILADAWLAIATGTAAANWPTTVVARGMRELGIDNQFVTSLPGLAALRTAEKIVPEGARDRALDTAHVLMQLVATDGGLVRTRSGGRVLVEVDPDFPIAPRLRASDRIASAPAERRRMFTQMVLHLRKMVEIGALRRQIDPVSEGPGGAVGRFLFELHENGVEHGSRDGQGKKIPGSRLLRVRKHIANRPEDLSSRHGGVPELRAYLERIHASALVEASISDFGLGIVDGFLASPSGASHAGRDRRGLLHSLLFERLSSKGVDPASGLGIQRALRAANQMQAFVSLRTAEFWLAASFVDAAPEIRMIDVGPEMQRGRVRGTHWQFLWPQP
jgi:hypothetical protein